MPDIDKYSQISQVLDLSLEELLGSHEGARTIQIVQNDEPMPVEDLVQAAPLMKPAQVEQKQAPVIWTNCRDCSFHLWRNARTTGGWTLRKAGL